MGKQYIKEKVSVGEKMYTIGGEGKNCGGKEIPFSWYTYCDSIGADSVESQEL